MNPQEQITVTIDNEEYRLHLVTLKQRFIEALPSMAVILIGLAVFILFAPNQ